MHSIPLQAVQWLVREQSPCLLFFEKSKAFYGIFGWFEKMGIPTLGWHNWNLSRRRGFYPRRGETHGGLTTLAGQDQSCRLKLLERKEGVRYWWSHWTGGIWISRLVSGYYYNTWICPHLQTAANTGLRGSGTKNIILILIRNITQTVKKRWLLLGGGG